MKLNKNIRFVFGFFIPMVVITACKGTSDGDMIPEESKAEQEETFDWNEIAEESQKSLMREYWSSQHYFNQDNDGHIGFNYWWNAHGMDVLVDAYLRSGNEEYLSRIDMLLEGCRARNGDTMWNTFYDDMEWMALACLRVYEASGNSRYKEIAKELWGYIKEGWSDIHHGGIAWASGSPNSKNACSNAPAAILAARLFQLDGIPEDLEWAKRIYTWFKEHLVDPSRGVVWDGYGNHNENNIYTYNQGTYIGASLELYEITKEESYLTEAVRNANYIINDRQKFSPKGILKGENTGDGGLFKGIFMRYFVELTKEPDLDDFTRETYLKYTDKNAVSLWTTATLMPDVLFGHTWAAMSSGQTMDCSVHLSGVMLLELRGTLSGWYNEEK
ncbi:glycoside hydrolase family 76 protein [Sinomicrobium sp. M5D2P17]